MEPLRKTLRDFGEDRILSELIAPRFPPPSSAIQGIGDDCAVLNPTGSHNCLVWTTDPCPAPAVCMVDQTDYFLYGWLTVLINVSDLASMGAKPLGLLVSTVMPQRMVRKDYEEFLDGLKAASDEWQCPVLGGNIKDGPTFTATATALGIAPREGIMYRRGAEPSDIVCVVGEMGSFWAVLLNALSVEQTNCPPKDDVRWNALRRPIARLREGLALADKRIATACVDSSDGIISCLHQIAKLNELDLIVDRSRLVPSNELLAATRSLVHSQDQKEICDNLLAQLFMLSWGDWQLVFTAAESDVSAVLELMKDLGTACTPIGHTVEGEGRVFFENSIEIPDFGSKRFAGSSIFTHGVTSYVSRVVEMAKELTIASSEDLP